MRVWFSLVLLASLLVGCSTASNVENATQETAPGGKAELPTATRSPAAEATMQKATPVSQPMGIKVDPPRIPIVPVQGTPAFPGATSGALQGWQSFTSPALGVAVDYPMDWSAAENDQGASFTSPHGAAIVLKAAQPGAGSTNQNCNTVINRAGLAAVVCVEAGVYSATFNIQLWQVRLSTDSRAALDVYKAMLNSLRPAQ